MNNLFDTFTQEYRDDILVRLAHHSAGIEGNTISLPATAAIIVNGLLPTSGAITVREFYEIDNHKAALAQEQQRMQAFQDMELESATY